MILTISILAGACLLWLWAEIKDRTKRFRITLGVVTCVVAAAVIFQMWFVWGYDKYHYRVSLSKIAILLKSGQTDRVLRGLDVYTNASYSEPLISFAASYKMNVALGNPDEGRTTGRTVPPSAGASGGQ